MTRLLFAMLLAGCTAPARSGQTTSDSPPRSEPTATPSSPTSAPSDRATSEAAQTSAPAAEGEPRAAPAQPKGRLSGMLQAHNRARAQHCAPPLAWSTELAAYAQQWAEALRDRGCAFEHRQRSPYGENLAYLGPAGTGTAAGVTESWVDERQRYNFARGDFDFATGHFTQIVWRDTKAVGCAVTTCGPRAELWVCNYSPPGNVMGEFRRQVLPTSCR